MQIKWIFEDIKPGQIRGPVATSEDGNYQIVFESKTPFVFIYHLYKNSECISAFEFCNIDNFDFSELLVEFHKVIERIKEERRKICGNCEHFKADDFVIRRNFILMEANND